MSKTIDGGRRTVDGKNSEDLLEIVYESEDIIAINKPHGLLVHRSKIANDAKEFALQLLRNQINQRVYPAHLVKLRVSFYLPKIPTPIPRFNVYFNKEKLQKPTLR